MEVFIRNVPEQSSDRQLRDVLRPYLKRAEIYVFDCHKFKGKGLATLTVLDAARGRLFLAEYGDVPLRNAMPNRPKCTFHGRELRFTVSRNPPDSMTLQSLQKNTNDRATASKRSSPKAPQALKLERKYPYVSISCGVWDSTNSNLAFVPHFNDIENGHLMFGKHALALLVQATTGNMKRYRADFSYSSIQSITLGNFHNPTLTLTLSEAPKFFGVTSEDLAINALLSRLVLGPQSKAKAPQRTRLASLGSGHETVVGSCFVYRVRLEEPSSLRHVQNLLRQVEKFPPSISLATPTKAATAPFYFEMARLSQNLALPTYHLSFGVKFQLQKLAQNGFLAPLMVSQLIPEVARIQTRVGTAVCVETLRKFLRQIPFAGPDAEPQAFDLGTLLDLLHYNEEKALATGSYKFDLTQQHSHIALIHKATVTPTGIFLEGPEPESKNRVLRKYSLHLDFFLRVSFLDEDGGQIRFDKHVSLDEIFNIRFKSILEDAIDIAGRRFEFLGFSHSSLREQTCWFMAPFVHEGKKLDARGVIAALGDFSNIRSPAKCAARIGQAFSETNGTVKLPPGTVRTIPDIERNGRVFSDGVGTFSPAILQMVWREYGQKGTKTSRLLQIRWAGAKGMISLDTRLEGERVHLRPSQIKFESPDQAEIEICGSAPCLPMRLNRQFIKILEDLGVAGETFMQLQALAVEQLQHTTENPFTASHFLERNHIGRQARVPWLIRKLCQIDLDPLNDPFIRSIVEFASILQLRELKYRSRIPIEHGVTLFGIMDETDTLEEGQIYCCTDKFVVTGQVVITRAPALHPGDIQVATCVEVADDSPLNALHNCVVFSQRGARDLPSQLSGGDLDGDLYNVIWDSRLLPKRTVTPADYPRVNPIDIGRTVERSDMTSFFIQFMENDQLGRLSTLHQQLADFKSQGTEDRDCKLLAEMCSTAVDFSKTGIAVDISTIPRYKRFRPDFMAPGPRCKIEQFGIEVIDDQNLIIEEESDLISQLDPESSQMRYYETPRILGHLYRAIDEYKFLRDLKAHSKAANRLTGVEDMLLGPIWAYVKKQTLLIQWEHHKENAREIRETYEDCLVDTIYQYSASASFLLTETEVFVGSVLGKDSGIPNKRLRQAAMDMKEKFDRDVYFTINCIVMGLEEDSEVDRDEALARSIACLAVAVEEPGTTRPRMDKLVSFAYIAAAVCLKEVEAFHGKPTKKTKATKGVHQSVIGVMR